MSFSGSMTKGFSTASVAGRFANEIDDAEREGSCVTVHVHGHAAYEGVRALARDYHGTIITENVGGDDD